MKRNKETWILFLLGCVTIIWGLNVIMVKYVASIFPVFQVSAWRIAIAAICLLIFTYKHWSKSWQHISKKSWIYIFLIGASSIFAHQLTLAQGLTYTSGSTGSLILALNPLTTALLAMLVLGDRFELKRFIGIGLGFFGVLLIVGQPSGLGEKALIGDAIMFASMLSYVIGGLLVKKVMAEVDVFSVTTFSHVIGAILLLLSWLILPTGEMVYQVPAFPYLVLIFSGVVATALGTTLWNIGIREIGPSRTTLFLNVMPLSSLIFASIFLGEQITWFHGVALLFIMMGIYLGLSKGQKQLKLPEKQLIDTVPIGMNQKA